MGREDDDNLKYSPIAHYYTPMLVSTVSDELFNAGRWFVDLKSKQQSGLATGGDAG